MSIGNYSRGHLAFILCYWEDVSLKFCPPTICTDQTEIKKLSIESQSFAEELLKFHLVLFFPHKDVIEIW